MWIFVWIASIWIPFIKIVQRIILQLPSWCGPRRASVVGTGTAVDLARRIYIVMYCTLVCIWIRKTKKFVWKRLQRYRRFHPQARQLSHNWKTVHYSRHTDTCRYESGRCLYFVLNSQNNLLAVKWRFVHSGGIVHIICLYVVRYPNFLVNLFIVFVYSYGFQSTVLRFVVRDYFPSKVQVTGIALSSVGIDWPA